MVVLKSREEIEILRRANVIVAEALAVAKEMVRPGLSTGDIDEALERFVIGRQAKAAFKGYSGYPASACISLNDEVVHGIPRKDRTLKTGDIVGIDFGVCMEGFYGDAAVTVPVGAVSEEALALMRATEESLELAIDKARLGNRLSDISHAVQSHVEKKGFTPVRDFVGHGIGRKLHEEPQIPNYGLPNRGIRLKAGMVLAIEPMINAGSADVVIKEDGWTAATRDGRLSAHFEHSVAITEDGPYVLSRL